MLTPSQYFLCSFCNAVALSVMATTLQETNADHIHGERYQFGAFMPMLLFSNIVRAID